MTSSIYHFFANLIAIKASFWEKDLEDLPYDRNLVTYQGRSSFPDLSLNVNTDSLSELTGGELIELKNSKNYGVASFNSQIPQQRKNLDELSKDVIKKMRAEDIATDNLFTRDVYFGTRFQKQNK